MPLLSGASYASLAQFFGPGGLPATALGARTTADAQAALDQSTADIDSLAFRGIYGPGFIFSAVGVDVGRRCVQHARWLFLDGQRGYDPQAGADSTIKDGEDDFRAWCDRVHRRAEFPDVTINVAPQYAAQPMVTSQSVVNDLGRVAPQRGW